LYATKELLSSRVCRKSVTIARTLMMAFIVLASDQSERSAASVETQVF
jgi:hypothetical protein